MHRATLSQYSNSLASLILSIICLWLYYSGITQSKTVLAYGWFFLLRIGIYILHQKADEQLGYGVGDAFHSIIYFFFSIAGMLALKFDLEAHDVSPDLRSTYIFFIIFFAVVCGFELILMVLSNQLKKYFEVNKYNNELDPNIGSHFSGPLSLAALMAAIISLVDGVGILVGKWPGPRILGIVLLAASVYILSRLYNYSKKNA